MRVPSKIQRGIPFKSAIISKVDEIADYLSASKPVAGHGISITEGACGSVIEAIETPGSGMGGNETEFSHPFKLSVVSDESDNAQVAIAPGVIEVQGASPIFSQIAYEEPCHPFDFSAVDDGYYYIVAYAKNAADKINYEFGIFVLSLGAAISEFSFPSIGGNSFHAVGIVRKISSDEAYILTVHEQSITSKIIVTDIDSELPFTAAIYINIGDVSALKTASSFAITSAWIRPGYIYNEEAKTSIALNDTNNFVPVVGWNCAMIQQNLEQGAAVPYAIIWVGGSDWSNIQPYNVDETGKIIQKNILLSKMYVPADYSIEYAVLLNYNPLNLLNTQGDTYKVKVNEDDDQPDYISVKVTGDEDSTSTYELGTKGYIQIKQVQATVTEQEPNPPWKLGVRFDYKAIPGYPGGENPKIAALISDTTDGMKWDQAGKVAVSSSDTAIQFLGDKLKGEAATAEYDKGYIGFFEKEVGTGTGILSLKAQWHFKNISGYDATKQYALTVNASTGEPAWSDVLGKVKSVASGQLGYLMDRLSRNAANTVITITNDGTNTDPFFDVAFENVTGYDATKKQYLLHDAEATPTAKWAVAGFLEATDLTGAGVYITAHPTEDHPNALRFTLESEALKSSLGHIAFEKTFDTIEVNGVTKFDLSIEESYFDSNLASVGEVIEVTFDENSKPFFDVAFENLPGYSATVKQRLIHLANGTNNAEWSGEIEIDATLEDLLEIDDSQTGRTIIKLSDTAAGLYYCDGTSMTKLALADGVLTCTEGVLAFDEPVTCPNALE